MMKYLTNVWSLSTTHAAGIINIWNGITPALTIFFSFFVDAFMGDFYMLVLSSIAYSIEIGSSFSGGGYEYNPAEIRHTFKSAGEKFLWRYINMRTQRISVLLRKRLSTPNWIKEELERLATNYSRRFKVYYVLNQVGNEVFLKSILNCTETVVRGWVKSLDPNEQVGGKEIGREWCEVNVQVAIKRDEGLVRPYGLFGTIEDAIGASIAWPCPFISVVRED